MLPSELFYILRQPMGDNKDINAVRMGKQLVDEINLRCHRDVCIFYGDVEHLDACRIAYIIWESADMQDTFDRVQKALASMNAEVSNAA